MARGPRFTVTTGLLGLVFLLALGFALWGGAAGVSPALGVLAVSCVGIAAFLLMNRLMRRGRELDHTLTQSERYVTAVADLSMELHLLVDPLTGQLLYANAALESILGLERERFLETGLTGLLDRVHPEDRAALEEALRGGGSAPGDPEPVTEVLCRLQAEDGTERWLRSRCQVFHRDPAGRVDEVLLVAGDLTQAKQLEALLPRSLAFESLGSVAGAVVHDLNNALMAIQLEVEQASIPGLPERLQKALALVGQESRRASDLSRQLLACTRRGRSQRVGASLNEVLRETLPLLERMVSDPVSLQVDLAPGLPEAFVDPDQLRHAALAMVSLALVSLGALRGEIRLRTALIRLEPGYTPGDLVGEYLCLEVQDTGRGLRPEQLRSLVLPDFGGGETGLDPSHLALHWIAREHKGTLEATQLPGAGARLRLFLPLADAVPAPATEVEALAPKGEGKLILVVEDEAVLRAALRMGLEEAGFAVLEAEDGVEGFALFVRNQPQVDGALIDLTMPRMNGDQLFEEIHALRPDLPVLLMSGYAEWEATEALGDRGLAGFLSKPCSMRAVREALLRVVK